MDRERCICKVTNLPCSGCCPACEHEAPKKRNIYEEAIGHYQYGIDCDIFKEPVTSYARLAVQAIRQKQEVDALAAAYGIDAKTMLELAKSQIKTTKSNIELTERIEEAETLIAKLAVLCNVPSEWKSTLLRRHINRPGDYMGCGYDFLDAFNRIWDEFIESTDEDFYHGVIEKMQSQPGCGKHNM